MWVSTSLVHKEYSDSSNYARGHWDAGINDVGPYTSIRLYYPDNYQEVYIEFDARMPGVVYGYKFIKIFGRSNDPVGFANTTFNLDYTGIDDGGLLSIIFGDGSTTTNDAQNIVRLDGTTDASDIGRGWNSSSVNTPMGEFNSRDWADDWHHFRIYLRFNSGTTAETESPDGALYLEIDGKIYADVGGLYNRHYYNSLYLRGDCRFSDSTKP